MAQFLLPSPVSFQVTPAGVNYDSLVSKMYQPKRAILFPRSPYARSMGGLGVNPPTLRDCGIPPDPACVEADTADSVAYQQAQQAEVASGIRDQCFANADMSPEPYRSQQIDACNARWPAGIASEVPYTNLTPVQRTYVMETPTQAAQDFVRLEDQQAAQLRADLARAGQTYIPSSIAPENVIKPNQSVPTTPLTPMQTGFQSTADKLVQQAAASSTGGSSGGQTGGSGDSSLLGNPGGKILGMDEKTFLIVAGAGLLLVLGARKS